MSLISLVPDLMYLLRLCSNVVNMLLYSLSSQTSTLSTRVTVDVNGTFYFYSERIETIFLFSSAN